MKRILVGVDGSTESRKAANFAAQIARATGASVTVASAVFMPVDGLGEPDLVARAAEWREQERGLAIGYAREVSAALADQGIETETATPVGPPAYALAELAKDTEVDLVVVGHRGRGAVARVLMGSVADRLVQISPKPVLVVR